MVALKLAVKLLYLISFLIITGCSIKKKDTPPISEPSDPAPKIETKAPTQSKPVSVTTKKDESGKPTVIPSTPPKPISPIVTDADAGAGAADAGAEAAVDAGAGAADARAEAAVDAEAGAAADAEAGAAPLDVSVETEVQSSCPTDKNVTTQTPLNVCTFPNSLKKSIETQLEMNCADVTTDHLGQIKQLTIRNIDKDELDILHDNDYNCYFTSIEKLDIAENSQVSYLPSFITNLSTLSELDISGTGISDFNKDICNLKKLVSLKANHNNYKDQEVPINTFCLSQLKVLDMSYSSIRYIDEYIHKLVQLEELHMRNNKLMVTPFMLHIMPSLLLIDLTENEFASLSWTESAVGYDSLNDLYNCKNESTTHKKEECQEDMLDNLRCGWWQELPFKRGYPFRRYKDMTDEEFTAHTAEGKFPSKNKCYLFWLNNKYVPFSEREKEAYSEHTINGKTLREWRVVFPAIVEHWGDWYGFKQSFTYCGQKMLYADTTYGPDSHEIFPKQYAKETWDKLPIECQEDSHLYE